MQDGVVEFARRDEGDGGAVREKGVQSAATAGGDWFAEGERLDDGSAERLAVGAGDDDIGGGDFGQGGSVRCVERQRIVQAELGSHLL